MILDRMAQVDRLHLLGMNNCAIAVQLGVDEKTVRNDLARADELYRERVGDDVQTNRAVAVRRLEGIVVLAKEAYDWDRSCERAVLLDEPLDGKRVYHDGKGSAQFRGNKAAALQAMEKAVMDIAKLQGIVVEKASLTDNDGNSLAALILQARANDADR